MPLNEITFYFSNEGSRNDVRMRVVNKFSHEEPGTGNGDNTSKYLYYVESLNTGNRVYLKRPANLHFGFDFQICVENTNYATSGRRSRNSPKHDDIKLDLLQKKEDNIEMYQRLYVLLQMIYTCHNVSYDEINQLIFPTGLPADHILKVAKWLFIEQDIRYWNYSGRHKTWEIIPSP